MEAFSAGLRDETDLKTLSGNLAGVIEDALQPAHVSLWLRPDAPKHPAAPAPPTAHGGADSTTGRLLE